MICGYRPAEPVADMLNRAQTVTADPSVVHVHFGGTEETNTTSVALVADAVVEYAGHGRVRSAVNAEDPDWT